MKKNNKILEAIQRGIKLALDDFDDIEQTSSKSNIVDTEETTKDIIDFRSCLVDLALPSGTIWFKYNLGCDYKKLNASFDETIAKDWYGDYYAWGEIEPNKERFSLYSYKFIPNRRSINYHMKKYAENKDWKFILDPYDDAAYISNSLLCMPSKEQSEELWKHRTHEWQSNYKGINQLCGMLFTGKNGNELFFPAAGWLSCKDGEKNGIYAETKSASCWTNKLYTGYDKQAYAISFSSGFSSGSTAPVDRYWGLPIRPILK